MAVKKTFPNPFKTPARLDGLDEFEKQLSKNLDFAQKDPDVASAAAISQEGNPVNIVKVASPEDWVNDQIQGAQNNADRWLRGVKNPSRSFKQAALANVNKHKVRTMEALNEDRYAKGMRNVNEDMAIETAERVGPQGYANGVAARRAKIQEKVRQMHPMIVAAKDALDAMPTETAAQAEAKAVAAIRAMREVGKRLRGG